MNPLPSTLISPPSFLVSALTTPFLLLSTWMMKRSLAAWAVPAAQIPERTNAKASLFFSYYIILELIYWLTNY